jgi:flavin reductase (DIM6/NTAB) family NADH-FMN oxidoreductase RutF/DNA-binding transcriptional LysR family regulator
MSAPSVQPAPGDGLPDDGGTLKRQFIEGMSFAACTVSVVTTDGPAGRLGVTVSAMSSVSADGARPTLLVCVHHQSPAAAGIAKNGVFCVNVLRDDQSMVSDAFAGRLKLAGGDKFSSGVWRTGVTGAPRVVDGLVAFDCRLQSQQRIGTHHVFIGEVEEIVVSEGGSPLIYANRAYGTPSPLAPPQRDAGGTLVIGAFQSFAPYLIPRVLSRLAETDIAPDARILAGDQDYVLQLLRTGEAEIALVYDFGIGTDFDVSRLGAFAPYVLLPDAHPLAHRHEIALADLAPHPMVLFDVAPSGRYFQSLFEAAGLNPQIRYRTSSFETVRGLVANGLGFSLLTTKPASPMSYDGYSIVAKRLTDETEKSHLALVSRRGAALSPAAQAFSAMARSVFDESAHAHA